MDPWPNPVSAANIPGHQSGQYHGFMPTDFSELLDIGNTQYNNVPASYPPVHHGDYSQINQGGWNPPPQHWNHLQPLPQDSYTITLTRDPPRTHPGLKPRKKPKRIRTGYTTSQIRYLEDEYEKCKYIDKSRRHQLSDILKIGEKQIKVWFQNRRMKEKKEIMELIDDVGEEETSMESTSGSASDEYQLLPNQFIQINQNQSPPAYQSFPEYYVHDLQQVSAVASADNSSRSYSTVEGGQVATYQQLQPGLFPPASLQEVLELDCIDQFVKDLVAVEDPQMRPDRLEAPILSSPMGPMISGYDHGMTNPV